MKFEVVVPGLCETPREEPVKLWLEGPETDGAVSLKASFEGVEQTVAIIFSDGEIRPITLGLPAKKMYFYTNKYRPGRP